MDATDPIKTCDYCGRKNAPDALNCQECGTSLEQEQPGEIRQILNSPLAKSSAAIAIATGLGAFLISTGVFCAFGSTSVEEAPLPKNPFFPGETTTYPSKEIINYSVVEERMLTLAIVVFTITVCWIRCQKRWHGILTATMTLGVMIAIPLFPRCLILVPAFVMGMTLDSSFFPVNNPVNNLALSVRRTSSRADTKPISLRWPLASHAFDTSSSG
jgi:hypothetical protein